MNVLWPHIAKGGPATWTLRLNEYQVANLMWLLEDVLGYGHYFDANGKPVHKPGLRPFTSANNGDWVGEIAQMLHKQDYGTEPPRGQKPNATVEDLRIQLQWWLHQQLGVHGIQVVGLEPWEKG